MFESCPFWVMHWNSTLDQCFHWCLILAGQVYSLFARTWDIWHLLVSAAADESWACEKRVLALSRLKKSSLIVNLQILNHVLKSSLEHNFHPFHCATLNESISGRYKSHKNPKARLQEVDWMFWGGKKIGLYCKNLFFMVFIDQNNRHPLLRLLLASGLLGPNEPAPHREFIN